MSAPSCAVARPARGGIAWQLAGERLGLLAWPRAILLQVAHPLVAAGVADHSRFRHSLAAPYVRLHETVRAMRALTFGRDAEAEAALAGILRIHDRVRGTLPVETGAFRVGTSYSAHDPSLVLWVHATLLDSYGRVLGLLWRPLSPTELDAYCEQAAPLAAALGARAAELPRRWAALQEYMAGEVAAGRVRVGAQARALADAVLRPPLAWALGPLPALVRRLTVGTLPMAVRDQYGFAWSAADQARLDRACARLARLRAHAPAWLARWPEARRAG